jgi:hypothetical protein
VPVGLGKLLLFLIAIHGFAPGNKRPRLSPGFKTQADHLAEEGEWLERNYGPLVC